MALTLDELAILVDSSIQICITDEATEAVSLQITGAQIRIGAGPELVDVTGVGASAGPARDDYAAKVAGKVMVVGGNPRGLEVHVPTTVIA